MESIVKDFFVREMDEFARGAILDAVENCGPNGARYLTFDAYNVSVDVSDGWATIEDALEADSSVRVPLDTFLGLVGSWHASRKP